MAPNPMREPARQMRREGLPVSQIAEACGVTKGLVSYWCRDLPEHAAATASNTARAFANRRTYPLGTAKLAAKLAAQGVPVMERLRITREAAAGARA